MFCLQYGLEAIHDTMYIKDNITYSMNQGLYNLNILILMLLVFVCQYMYVYVYFVSMFTRQVVLEHNNVSYTSEESMAKVLQE